MNQTTLMIAIAIFTFSCTYAFAALPPLYETLREYKSLIEDPRFEKSFTSADVIEKIERTDNENDREFIITTNKRTVHVHIVYEPATMPGPSKFNLIFEESQPKKEL